MTSALKAQAGAVLLRVPCADARVPWHAMPGRSRSVAKHAKHRSAVWVHARQVKRPKGPRQGTASARRRAYAKHITRCVQYTKKPRASKQ